MHDRNGTPIKKGDTVLVKARVAEAYGGVDYCNVQLTIGFEAEHGPANVTSSVTINTRQTLLFESGAEQPSESDAGRAKDG